MDGDLLARAFRLQFWWWLAGALFLAWLCWDWWPLRYLFFYNSAVVALLAAGSTAFAGAAAFTGGAGLLVVCMTPYRAVEAWVECALTFWFAWLAWDWWWFRAAFLTLGCIQTLVAILTTLVAAAFAGSADE